MAKQAEHRACDLVLENGSAIGPVVLQRVDEELQVGTITLDAAPARVVSLFEEYEACVEGQALSVIDELDSQIAALGLQLRCGSDVFAVHDVQVYPSSGRVSLRL